MSKLDPGLSQLQRAFEKDIDLLVSPVSPTPAMGVGEKADDPVSMYAQDILTIPASLAVSLSSIHLDGQYCSISSC